MLRSHPEARLRLLKDDLAERQNAMMESIAAIVACWAPERRPAPHLSESAGVRNTRQRINDGPSGNSSSSGGPGGWGTSA